MTKEGQPQIHEFWLRKYPDSPGNDPVENTGIYRVALGDLIDAKSRQVYPPSEGSQSPEFWNKSGSVGFLDITIKNELIPKDNAIPYPNPNHVPSLEYEYPIDQCERKRALFAQIIGIEPQHRGKGYARLLMQKVEKIAALWGLEIIVAEMIENPIMREFNKKLGYVLYNRGMNAVKRLETSGSRKVPSIEF